MATGPLLAVGPNPQSAPRPQFPNTDAPQILQVSLHAPRTHLSWRGSEWDPLARLNLTLSLPDVRPVRLVTLERERVAAIQPLSLRFFGRVRCLQQPRDCGRHWVPQASGVQAQRVCREMFHIHDRNSAVFLPGHLEEVHYIPERGVHCVLEPSACAGVCSLGFPRMREDDELPTKRKCLYRLARYYDAREMCTTSLSAQNRRNSRTSPTVAVWPKYTTRFARHPCSEYSSPSLEDGRKRTVSSTARHTSRSAFTCVRFAPA